MLTIGGGFSERVSAEFEGAPTMHPQSGLIILAVGIVILAIVVLIVLG